MRQFFPSGGQSIGALASASVLPMNIHGWFPLGLTDLISLQFRGLSRVLSSTTVWSHQFFGSQPFFFFFPVLTSVHDYWKSYSFDYTDLCQQSNVSAFYMLSRFIIAFLPRSKCLLISWLQSESTVISEPKKIKSVTVSIVSLSICHEMMKLDTKIFAFWILSFKLAWLSH